MKISLGIKIQDGPWGGGNQFGLCLSEYLIDQGNQVFFDLTEPDLDLIVLVDPRVGSQTSNYTDREIIHYLLTKNRQALVVHRINECDERKNTQGVNRMLIKANQVADHTVFISDWLNNLLVGQGLDCPSVSVIHNGADRDVFNAEGFQPWNGSGPLRIVTHHWGGHWMKGFDVYGRLDEMLTQPEWSDKIEFAYIGNLPAGFQFTNTNYIPPLSGHDLAAELKKHHLYLTASQNEPAGMHHVEGAMCGLPVLFRNSGPLPEYCTGYGLVFEPNDFESSLEKMMAEYDHWAAQMPGYANTAEKMCSEYFALFKQVVGQRNKLIRQRRLWKRPGYSAPTWFAGRVARSRQYVKDNLRLLIGGG